MEEILKKITANDTALIREGTAQLKNALKSPDALPALCSTMQSCPDSQLRQAAALTISKRFRKSKHWYYLQENIQLGIKDSLLKALIAEPEKFVKNTICHAIGEIIVAEHQSKKSWSELTHFLQQTTTSDNQNDRELGFYTLSLLTAIAPEPIMQFAGSFSILFNKALSNAKDQGTPMAYYAIICLINFVPVIGDRPELKNIYNEVLPKVISSITALSAKRPDRAHEAMDLLYDLSEPKTADLLKPRMKQIVNMCLDFIRDSSMKMDVQIKSFGLLAILVQANIEIIIKMDLLVSILHVVLKTMCEKPEDEEDEDYFSADPDEDTLLTSACETLDEIALNADAEVLIPHIMEFVERGMKGTDPYIHKACYLSIGIVAQGADDYIKENCLTQLTKLIIKGVASDKPVVRNAALFALGQFTDCLQPEINQFTGELIPIILILLSYLEEKGKNDQLKTTADRVFFAAEKLLDNIEDGIEGILPELIQKLLRLSCPPYENHLRQLAIGAIGSAANSAKEAIIPYFKPIMTVLNEYIMQPLTPENANIHVEAIDTLGYLIRNIGLSAFEPIADDTIKVGLNLMRNCEDPDIKKACYGLFAAISSLLKERIAPILPTVMESIINSIKSEEGIVSPDKGNMGNSNFAVYGSEDEESEDNEDDYEFSTENDFIEEKEESCIALKELAENSGESFFPFLELSYVEVMKLLNFRSSDIKKVAAEACFQLAICFSNINTPEGQNAARQVISNLIVKGNLMVRTEEEKEVVVGVLECFQHLLQEIGAKLDMASKENILSCVKDVLEGKTECQLVEDDDDENEELLDTAFEVIPIFGKTVSHDEFASYFNHFTPLFKKRCEENNASARANMMGTLAESLEPLGPYSASRLEPFLSYVLCMTKDTDPQVRNNAVYFLGEFAFHGKEQVLPQYGMLLNALFGVMSSEKNWKVLDNICGAIARLILVSPTSLPLDRVVPALMEHLPLKEDYIEDKWIFRSITLLYSKGEEMIKKFIGHIIKCAAISLHSHTPDDETKEVLVNLIKMCYKDFPNDFRTVVAHVPVEIVNILQLVCSS